MGYSNNQIRPFSTIMEINSDIYICCNFSQYQFKIGTRIASSPREQYFS